MTWCLFCDIQPQRKLACGVGQNASVTAVAHLSSQATRISLPIWRILEPFDVQSGHTTNRMEFQGGILNTTRDICKLCSQRSFAFGWQMLLVGYIFGDIHKLWTHSLLNSHSCTQIHTIMCQHSLSINYALLVLHIATYVCRCSTGVITVLLTEAFSIYCQMFLVSGSFCLQTEMESHAQWFSNWTEVETLYKLHDSLCLEFLVHQQHDATR